MSDLATKYLNLFLELLLYRESNNYNFEKDEKLCEELDIIWKQLNFEEIDLIEKYLELLNHFSSDQEKFSKLLNIIS